MTLAVLDEPLVSPEELQSIELVVRTRMKEHATGSHQSVFQGEGFNFVGLRDWQPGDRPSAIDWAQSTITNFSPLVTRDFEKDSTASVMIIADASRSTRCGARRQIIARVIARAVATLSLAAAFSQDYVGLATFNRWQTRARVRPKAGRAHALHCVESYQDAVRSGDQEPADGVSNGGQNRRASGLRAEMFSLLRRTSFVPVISDFLFPDMTAFVEGLGEAASVHDVVLVIIDAGFAYEMPTVSAGWMEVLDAESGETRLLAVGELDHLAERARVWQRSAAETARGLGVETVTLRVGHERETLAGFLEERRLRKR